MTHTPGPWQLEKATRSVRIPLEPHHDAIAYCGTLANARLIAAAPETAAERDKLKSANEHWHVRVTALKADVDVSLAERDRLKAINAELVIVLELISQIQPDKHLAATAERLLMLLNHTVALASTAIAKAQGDQ